MRKLLVLFTVLLIFIGCKNMSETPTKKVEDLLMKYQKLDEKVLGSLDYTIETNSFNEEQKERYREIIRNQYKNLTYEIKGEKLDGDKASVDILIEVFDYSDVSSVASEFFKLNQDYFLDENGIVDNSKYTDYKLDLMEKEKKKIKYTITINLTRKDDEWSIDEIDQVTLQKIHGIYNNG